MTWKSLSRRARHLGEAAAAYFAFGLLRLLPVAWASALGGGLLRMLGPHLSASRRGRRNLERAFPEKTPAEREAILLSVWDNLGRTAAEYPHLATIAASRTEVVGGERITRMAEDGQPGIFITAHIGNWEVNPIMVDRAGIPLTIVYRAPNNPYIDAMIRRFRSASATTLVPKGQSGARALLSAMKAGGHLALLIDQKMNDGVAVPFFGRPAMTAPAVADFALRYACPLISCHIERLPGARFRMIVSEPFYLQGDPKAPPEQRRADILAGLTRMNEMLESWIRARPGEWLWLHKRWPD